MGIEHAWDRIGCRVEEIDTPALLVDVDALEGNIRRMAEFGARVGIGIRPHGKAHKTPLIAHKQVAAGAIGICCQKVGEAEVMVAGGVQDVLISNEVVGAAKVARLVSLARQARMTIAVDAVEPAEALAAAAVTAGVSVGVVVDLDIGQGRCGVAPGPPALALAEKVARIPGLVLRGLQGYQGRLQHVVGHAARVQAAREATARLLETRSLFEARGLPLEIVTGGGTGTYDADGTVGGLTDIQPGSYIFMDRQYREIGGRSGPVYDDFACALTVQATVMSTPAPDRVVLDAGLKALSNDVGPAMALDLPGWEYVPAGDEHGLLLARGDRRPLRLAETVRLLPSHCDTTVNLYDRFHAVRGGRLEAIWTIPARGRIR